ncbi:unnamed protein product, partial [Didymodactylos carnosus]
SEAVPDPDYGSLCTQYDFKCKPEEKCLVVSSIVKPDYFYEKVELDKPMLQEKIPFQIICNGFVEMSPILIDQHNETDETNCPNE